MACGRRSPRYVGWPTRSQARSVPTTTANAQPVSGRPIRLEASARLREAQRSILHIPIRQTSQDEASPPKCSLLGSYEQMGPAGLNASRGFWDKSAAKITVNGIRLRGQERFSAIALCKRFASLAFLTGELYIDPAALRFLDTATVAAAEWLAGAGIDPDKLGVERDDWNGRWLHQKRRDDVEQGKTKPLPRLIRD